MNKQLTKVSELTGTHYKTYISFSLAGRYSTLEGQNNGQDNVIC